MYTKYLDTCSCSRSFALSLNTDSPTTFKWDNIHNSEIESKQGSLNVCTTNKTKKMFTLVLASWRWLCIRTQGYTHFYCVHVQERCWFSDPIGLDTSVLFYLKRIIDTKTLYRLLVFGTLQAPLVKVCSSNRTLRITATTVFWPLSIITIYSITPRNVFITRDDAIFQIPSVNIFIVLNFLQRNNGHSISHLYFFLLRFHTLPYHPLKNIVPYTS